MVLVTTTNTPALNKKVPYGSHSTILPLFESKSSGSKRYRRTFLIDKNPTSAVARWHDTLKDYSINNDNIVDSFKFASSKVVQPKYHDKKLWLLYRKTHFNNQICKYNNEISPFCTWCKKTHNIEVKEDFLHATSLCPKISDLPAKLMQSLKIEHLSKAPYNAKKIILGISESLPSSRIVMDTIWLIYTCLILSSRITDTPISVEYLANKIKLKISAINKCYPSRNLGKCSKSLNLEQFLASHDIGSNIHWTTFTSTSKLRY